ncbi:hypothetical protein Tco_1428538 [Tanacetum coccineum]
MTNMAQTSGIGSSSLARLVVARPKSVKEAWGLISDIVKDNKRSHTNTLKVELRSIKLGDQSMEYYFQKIDSIVNILTSLDAHVNEEDVVHYALYGLPNTYNQVWVQYALEDTVSRSQKRGLLLISRRYEIKVKSACFAYGFVLSHGFCGLLKQQFTSFFYGSSGFNKGRGSSKNSTNDLLNKFLAQLRKLGMNTSHTGTNTVSPTVSSSINLNSQTGLGPSFSSNKGHQVVLALLP